MSDRVYSPRKAKDYVERGCVLCGGLLPDDVTTHRCRLNWIPKWLRADVRRSQGKKRAALGL